MFGEKKAMKTRICINDFIAVAAVLLVALALFLAPLSASNSAQYVKIIADGKEQLVSIHEDREYIISSNGHSLTVNIEDGEASILHSTCSDKVCVNSGKINRGGEVVVCAPALVSIEIVGETEEFDYAVG